MSAGGMDGINWWSSVDLIGVSPYYSLSSAPIPAVGALEYAWVHNWLPFLKNISDTYQRPVLMDEIGYASQLQAAYNPATAWQRKHKAKPSQKAQENAYRALLDVSSAPAQQPWLRGVMWFGWDKVRNPVRDKSYLPRDKTAECAIASSWGTASVRGTRGASGIPDACIATHAA
jgi:arabinogalactan endo-1,4-beta-galactosidase